MSRDVWLSKCGKYMAVRFGDDAVEFDVLAMNSDDVWLGRRYRPKGFRDKDPRFLYPEFPRMVVGYSNEIEGFKLRFADLDTTKKIDAFTGNCVIRQYEATFTRKRRLRGLIRQQDK